MKKVFFTILLVIAGGVFLFSLWKVGSILLSYRQGVEVYEDVKKEYRETIASETGDSEAETDPESLPDYSAYEKEGSLSLMGIRFDYVLTPQYEFDFEKLLAMNADIRGWIILSGTNIDYPVVQSKDNKEYLRRAADGTSNNCGSIFIDCRITDPFHQQNTIIYGHNQRNSRMFHDLMNYENADFAAEHPVIEIYETDGTHHMYQVFSAYVTLDDSPSYQVSFDGSQDLRNYLDYCLEQSTSDFQVPVTVSDTIITLSTCTNEGDTERMIVQARRMN